MRQTAIWRLHLHAVGALILLLTLIIFSPPNIATANERVVLQLKWYHAFQFAGYYAAQEQGYYKEAGLDVEILPASPDTNVLENVLDGKAEYGVGTSSLLLERKAEKPVVVLAVIFQHSPLVLIARRDNDTQNIHDIIDKRIMIEPQSDEILAYLRKEGLPVGGLKRIEHSFNPQDLTNGRADVMSAYSTNERYFFDLSGVPYQIYTPRSAGIDFYGDNLFTTEGEIDAHPERVKAFRAASIRGWKYAMAHPEEIVDLIIAKYPTKYSREFLIFEAKEMISLIRPDLVEMGYMYPGRWRHIASIYAELGMLPKDFSLEGFLYNPNKKEDLTWLYRTLAITLAITLLITGVSLYIYRANQRLNYALAESKKAKALIWNQAHLDDLTQLPNRRMFWKNLGEAIDAAALNNQKMALMFLDLDDFKEVNDTYGHDKGDQLLILVSQRLQQHVAERGIVARLGGDEFSIIIENTDDDSIKQIAASLILSTSMPYALDNHSVCISLSVGISIYPDDGEGGNIIFKNADIAMYEAKRRGHNNALRFNSTMRRGTSAMDKTSPMKEV